MKHEGNATIQYFEGSRYVGSRQMYCCGAGAEGERFSAYWPHVAFFCPQCGELWGRAIYQREFDYHPRVTAEWHVETKHCARCGDGQFLSGLPLDGADKDLLTRELLALMEGVVK